LTENHEASFLFWNIKRSNTTKDQIEIEPVLAQLAKENGVDVLMLAEAGNLDESKLLEYIGNIYHAFQFVSTQSDKVKVLVRVDFNKTAKLIDEGSESRFACLSWFMAGKANLLVVAHLPSKLNNSPSEMKYRLSGWLDLIQRSEARVSQREKMVSQRRVIVGDLNMNPFESLMTDPPCFNAVSCAKIASRMTRKYHGKIYAYLYNPMWKFLGDSYQRQGTYFHNSPGADEVHWNILDQVLISPTLLVDFKLKGLDILAGTQNESFLNNHDRPNESYSDHLPIAFKLTTEEGAEHDSTAIPKSLA